MSTLPSGGGGYPTVAPGNGNGYGGAMCNENSSTTVINCTFSKNNANGRNGDGKGYGGYGGAMYNVDGNQTVTNCTFSLNTTDYDCYGGGAMYNGGGSQTVTNCTFSQNTANYGGGGMYNSGGSQTVTNCTFSHNGTKKDGGGMYNSGGSQTVTNCTFSGNWAHTDGGGAVCTNSKEGNTAIIVNSIFWDNSAINTSADRQEIYNPAGTLIIQNCVVSGDFNLASGGSSKDISNGDPMIFAVDKVMNATESAADTYMFIISGDNAQASSALGKGLAVGKHEIAGKPVNVPSTDQCGRVRLQDKVDIGAYQYNADRTVDGVSLTPTAVALLAGETTKLTATVTPAIAANKTVIWTTSDAETASVADGTVTAHKVGTAVITVTTQDGGKTAACTVTVSAANEKEAAKPATPPAKPENAPDNVTATSGPVEVIYVQPGATDEEKENAITEAAGKLEGITSKDLEATGSTVKIKEDLAKKLAEGILGKELSKDTVVPLPVFTAVCGAADGKVLMAAFEMTGSSFLADKPENAQFLKILSGDTAEFLGYVSKAEDFADGKFTVMTMDDAIFTGEFAADTTYKLVVFIKDGGKYDMDAGSERNEDGSKKPNGRIADPLAIIKTGASPTPTPNHNGGSGCNSGAFGSGMALLALCLPMLIKRRKR